MNAAIQSRSSMQLLWKDRKYITYRVSQRKYPTFENSGKFITSKVLDRLKALKFTLKIVVLSFFQGLYEELIVRKQQ